MTVKRRDGWAMRMGGRVEWTATGRAGDSRCVLCRKGKALPLSHDHKPADPVELGRIEAAGGFVTEAGRINGNLNLSRALGDLKYKGDFSRPPSKQIITAEPDVVKHDLQKGDEFIVLACDGIWDVMSNQQAVDFVSTRLKKGLKPGVIAEQMFEHCIADDVRRDRAEIAPRLDHKILNPNQRVLCSQPKVTQGIGGDNMTAIIVRLPTR